MPQRRKKNWSLSLSAPHAVLTELRDFHPVMAQVLYNRGFTDGQAALQFLTGEIPERDPFKMTGMAEAVARLRQAIRAQEPIAVYGDFDTDGVTSTALLVQTITALGGVVEPYIPDRVEDGYGLNSSALTQLAQDGFKLVVTVDCGMRAVQEVVDGQRLGLDIIITDHHSVGPELPPALAIINPKQADCDYPEDMLAGVGVAYYLAVALIKVAKKAGEDVLLNPADLLDLVALGTVADLAPMDRLENRSLVIRGLAMINKAHRPGLYALIEEVGLKPDQVKIRASHIGFALGPRINAAGRMKSASTAYELLITDEIRQANALAGELNTLNIQRQEATQAAQLLARGLAFQGLEMDEVPLIFAPHPDFEPGVVGLVAGRLVEEYYRPAVVVQIDKKVGECRGSCRSIPEFNIIQALDECAGLLIRHGGHAQAAGFSVLLENMEQLRDHLFEAAHKALHGLDLRPSLDIDMEVPMEQLTFSLAQELARLEPVGHRNQQPLFLTRNLMVLDSRRVGREGAHLKLTLGEPGFRLDAIAFRWGDYADDLTHRVDVVYQFEVNEWNGRKRAQMNVKDIRPSG